METPQSSRRITRSQALAMASENSNSNTTTKPISSRDENEESIGVLKSKQKTGKHQEREKSALFDITNGSPIVGLAMGSLKTPLFSKKRMMIPTSESKNATTPGSGESLLRGQVKSLLQKVEEEGMLNEVIGAHNQEDESETYEKNVITRSLFTDFSEKFEGCEDSSDCNSMMTNEGSDASLWSVQVNASTSTDEYKNEEDDDDKGVDEICEGISKISVNNGPKFSGKHIRFVYNSDGELESPSSSSSSSSSSS
ncbi:hypothetical protein L2E82_18301 [Cichorium intybus]|uniref:Uncharacterized protein n=1 Tax=Cichorium intybus TaxID=13427 RepID=A0ACB9FA05_CICIN|nr:hypothetical protein L2E82_18301 [Cichorium intybus]